MGLRLARLTAMTATVGLLTACSAAAPPPDAQTVLHPSAATSAAVAAADSASGGASIRAIVLSAPSGRRPGSAKVVWSAPGARLGTVRVFVDGSAHGTLFAEGDSGSAKAAFIVAGHTFVFRLFPSPDGTRPLASAAVAAH